MVRTMYCLNCGRELSPGTSFCASCGTPVQAQGIPHVAPAAPAPQASTAAVPVAQSAPQATTSPGTFAPRGVAQPYGQRQQPYSGFAGTAGTVANSVGIVHGWSFSQLIAITAAILGLLLFVLPPWLDLPNPAAAVRGFGNTGVSTSSSFRMSEIASLSELLTLLRSSDLTGLLASIDLGGMAFICTLWRISIIFAVYCTVNVIRHKDRTLLLQVALGIMTVTALFWIIGVNVTASGTTPLGTIKSTPAWGAIASFIVCGLGLGGSVFFGLGEKQRH